MEGAIMGVKKKKIKDFKTRDDIIRDHSELTWVVNNYVAEVICQRIRDYSQPRISEFLNYYLRDLSHLYCIKNVMVLSISGYKGHFYIFVQPWTREEET
jgi:hypothetical protein